MVGIATAIVFFHLTINLLLLAFDANDKLLVVQALGQISKDIEPLVRVANVILIADFGYNIVQKLIEEGVKEALKALLAKLLDIDLAGADDFFTGQLTAESVAFSLKTFSFVYNLHLKNKMDEIKDKNKDLKAENDRLQEELEREGNIFLDYPGIYSRPMTADWSMYASQFDRPYERTGGSLSIGNIMATTKKALRPADYDEEIFNSIMV